MPWDDITEVLPERYTYCIEATRREQLHHQTRALIQPQQCLCMRKHCGGFIVALLVMEGGPLAPLSHPSFCT